MVENSLDETHPVIPTPDEPDSLEDTKPRRVRDKTKKTADTQLKITPEDSSTDSSQIEDTLQVESRITPLSGLEETAGLPVLDNPIPMDSHAGGKPPTGAPPVRIRPHEKRSDSRRITWLLLPLAGVALLIWIGIMSAFGGYASGLSMRRGAASTQEAAAVEEQYQLALQDIEQAQYFRARQRLEYIINLEPDYPGAAEKLAAVLLELNTTATPTLLPSPTFVPTPDTRGVQEIFNQGQQTLFNSEWTPAIETLLVLRKTDPTFRAVDVDGMLFVALRNRGKDKILKEADLEGGIYDLTLASKFGPLDAEAQGLLNWSTLYITGASFWGIDWEQVVSYFEQVAPQTPNLMDGSKMTATERLRLGLFELGNMQASRGQFCKAVKSYQRSLEIAQDTKVQQAGQVAAQGCATGEQPETTPNPKKPKKTPGT